MTGNDANIPGCHSGDLNRIVDYPALGFVCLDAKQLIPVSMKLFSKSICMRMLSIFFILVLGMIPATKASAGLAGTIEIESRPGNVLFSHARHSGTACKQCHHEMSSPDTIVACRQCHTKQSTGKMSSVAIFHKDCIGCHAQQKQAGKKSGPVKLCSQCHKRAK